MSRWARVAVVVALLAGGSSCRDDRPGPGEARLEVDGAAEVERAGGERETVTGGTDLRPGDRVSMRRGSGRLELADRSMLELRAALDDTSSSVLLMARRPVLEQGDLLVSAPGRTTVEADGTAVEVREGSARVRRDIGMSVSSYDATVLLDSAGVDRRVPALRRMVVPDLGRPPQQPRPVRYDDADTWDRRFLGAAHALGERLQRLADGLTGSLAEGQGRTPGFFRSVLPGLDEEPDFGADLLRPRLDEDPGDTLVGAAIADLGERGDFRERWDEVFDFRDDGAEWGIVALDQAVSSEPLVGQVQLALDSSFGEVAFAPPGGDSGPPTSAPPTSTPPSPPSTAPPSTSPPTTSTPTPPVTQPGPPDPPPPLDPVVDPLTTVVDDVVDSLLGGLLG